MSYHEDWQKQWRSPAPKSSYDAIIVGGGGHGLATAYYLAKEHGMRNIAVVERGWLGGGNTALEGLVGMSALAGLWPGPSVGSGPVAGRRLSPRLFGF